MKSEKRGVKTDGKAVSLRRSEKKQILRHAVNVAEIVDRLMQEESDPDKLQYLKILRKENARIWSRLKV